LTLLGFLSDGSNIGSSVFLQSLLTITVLHIGQAVSSAISFKLGAYCAAVTFVIAAAILIGHIVDFASLATPLTCSACALVIARRHASSHGREDVG
jgi:hypothetical protein